MSIPLGINWRNLCDTKPKKIYLLTLTSTILLYRGFLIIKKFILWPFKLGIFSLFSSILGFDVTWFLSLFNVFTINIPQLIYFQYLLLYGNWMNWWHNIVNIKSLNTTSLPHNKRNENLNLDSPKTDNPDNNLIVDKTRFIIFISFVTLVGIGILYYFYNDFSGGGNIPPDNNYGDNHQINISDNQNRENRYAPRPKAKLNRLVDSSSSSNPFQYDKSMFRDPSGSNFNRFSVLDHLDQVKSEGPPSPTESNASS